MLGEIVERSGAQDQHLAASQQQLRQGLQQELEQGLQRRLQQGLKQGLWQALQRGQQGAAAEGLMIQPQGRALGVWVRGPQGWDLLALHRSVAQA